MKFYFNGWKKIEKLNYGIKHCVIGWNLNGIASKYSTCYKQGFASYMLSC